MIEVLIILWRIIMPFWIILYFFIFFLYFIKQFLHFSLFSRRIIKFFYICRNFNIINNSLSMNSLINIRITSPLFIILISFLIFIIKILFKFIFSWLILLILFDELILPLILRTLNKSFETRSLLIYLLFLLNKYFFLLIILNYFILWNKYFIKILRNRLFNIILKLNLTHGNISIMSLFINFQNIYYKFLCFFNLFCLVFWISLLLIFKIIYKLINWKFDFLK